MGQQTHLWNADVAIWPASLLMADDQWDVYTAITWQECVDNPVNWRSSNGRSCTSYKEMHLCTDSGEYGAGWAQVNDGTFEKHATNGVSAVQACCTCGGGQRSRAANTSATTTRIA